VKTVKARTFKSKTPHFLSKMPTSDQWVSRSFTVSKQPLFEASMSAVEPFYTAKTDDLGKEVSKEATEKLIAGLEKAYR